MNKKETKQEMKEVRDGQKIDEKKKKEKRKLIDIKQPRKKKGNIEGEKMSKVR